MDADIQSLIDQARRQVEQHGTLTPILHAQLEQEHHMLVLDTFEETQGVPWQMGAVARQGWELAKKYQGQRLVAASFVALAWQSDGETVEFTVQPRRDPQRSEVITTQNWTTETNAIQTYRLSVQREGKQITIGEPELTVTRQFTFLSVFLDGYRDGQRPDEEVFAEMESTIDQRLAALPPERQQALERLIAMFREEQAKHESF